MSKQEMIEEAAMYVSGDFGQNICWEEAFENWELGPEIIQEAVRASESGYAETFATFEEWHTVWPEVLEYMQQVKAEQEAQ